MVTPEATQDRGTIVSTASELFHQAALDRRLEQMPVDSPSTQSSDSSRLLDQTILNRSHNATRKFDLNQFLQNSIYPSEADVKTPSDQSILDASMVIDHFPGRTKSNERSTDQTQSSSSQRFDPNDTFVDEELIMNLTQRASNTTLMNDTLNENEHEVLEIFEMFDENDEPTHDETLRIDDDSVLAPFSQRSKETLDRQSKNTTETGQETSFEDTDSDDDLLNQFSMSIIDFLPNEHQNEHV